MKANSRQSLLVYVVLMFAAVYSTLAPAAGLTRVFYPDEANMAFSVDIPSDWKMIPQEDEDSYFEVEGPNGLELSFRIVPGGDIDKALKDHVAYLEENFTEITMSDAKEVSINGLEAILLPGGGVDEDEVQRDLGAGWFKLPGDQVGELWYNADDSDAAGKQAAIAVLNSLKGK